MPSRKKYFISFVFIILLLLGLLVFMINYKNGDDGVIYYPEISKELETDDLLTNLSGIVADDLVVEEEQKKEINETPIVLEDDLESNIEVKAESELEKENTVIVEPLATNNPKMMIVIERD